jgi:Fe-S-cluster-containing dehydrogenase component
MTRPCLLVDLDRCTGCQSCVVACREQKGTPAGVNLIRVVQIGPEGIFPHLNMYYLPVACQECEAPACAAACPEGAISRSSNDVVTVDVDKCNGCGECVAPCPYGAIVLDSAAALARKCDLCAEVWPENGRPACVSVCPTRAITVIDRGSPTADFPPTGSGRRAAAGVFALRASAGTDPAGRFVLSRQEWRDHC